MKILEKTAILFIVAKFDHLFIAPSDFNKSRAFYLDENTHWGTRWMVVRDPDGNLIAFNSEG